MYAFFKAKAIPPGQSRSFDESQMLCNTFFNNAKKQLLIFHATLPLTSLLRTAGSQRADPNGSIITTVSITQTAANVHSGFSSTIRNAHQISSTKSRSENGYGPKHSSDMLGVICIYNQEAPLRNLTVLLRV